jgi:hypothetical protein
MAADTVGTKSGRVKSTLTNFPPWYRSATGSFVTRPRTRSAWSSELSSGAHPIRRLASLRQKLRLLFDAPQTIEQSTRSAAAQRWMRRTKSSCEIQVERIRSSGASGRGHDKIGATAYAKLDER